MNMDRILQIFIRKIDIHENIKTKNQNYLNLNDLNQFN